ncbi:hypothetical protein HU200_021830 [Digitaria exilis]|uniref:Uncharacterized protein n=1 Tax=Digitaria exilis TaxID=1010633 RepID=A0A835EYY8_9POAL|nr:hypothetical protein HU200_021830 [Digitaria exilis]
MFPDSPGDYDPASGCDARFNKLAAIHNRALKLMLRELRLRYPGRSLVYADVYHPIIRAVTSPARYGFGSTPLVACCGGGGGPYNFNYAAFCGTPNSTTCEDPSQFVSWDGIHFTEAANELMAHAVLRVLMSTSAEELSSQQA